MEALGHASKGLELLGSVAQTPQRDRLELNLEIVRGTAYRAVKGFASSEAERSFARASAICMRLDDIPRLIDARRGLFSCYYARGALALAREQGNEVSAAGQNDGRCRAPECSDIGCSAASCFGRANTRPHGANSRRPLHSTIRMCNVPTTLALQIDPGANALLHLSWLLWILGYPEQALRNSEKAIATARQLGQPMALSMALFFAARHACEHRRPSGRAAIAGRADRTYRRA